jgi:hypothetical protein
VNERKETRVPARDSGLPGIPTEAQDRIRVLEAYIKRVCLHPAHAQPDSTPETCAHGVPIAKRRFCGPCNAIAPDSTGARE